MKHFLFAIILVGLSACSGVQKFTVGDLSNASAIATSNGDSSANVCWVALGGAIMASPEPANDGLAVLIERNRLVTGVANGPCASVILPIIMQLGSLGLRGF